MMEYEEYIVDLNADCVCGCMDGDRFHKIFHFPNGYGASVVANPKKEGFSKKGYRILLIKFSNATDYTVVTMPVFDSSVLECDTWEQTAESLKKIKEL
ncbi:MAG: hypothetical protein FWH44_01705 [Methanomassiliicoccaceae archaeon]|nr:hypothetical protein [Methanomassiliicoccaceae archaeon]